MLRIQSHPSLRLRIVRGRASPFPGEWLVVLVFGLTLLMVSAGCQSDPPDDPERPCRCGSAACPPHGCVTPAPILVREVSPTP